MAVKHAQCFALNAGHSKTKAREVKVPVDTDRKQSLLSCCLAPKTLDADWPETRDDVTVTSLEDHVRIK